jgi:isopenicillin N synthase-like dioxygenase
MNAILIQTDGRASLVYGECSADLTTIAVLTQAAISALDAASGAVSTAVQCHQDHACVTLLRHDDGAWLRVEHERGVTVEQVIHWAESLPPPPAAVVVNTSARTTSLADAMNVQL